MKVPKIMIRGYWTQQFWDALDIVQKHNWEIVPVLHHHYEDGRKKNYATYNLVYKNKVLHVGVKTFPAYGKKADKARADLIIWLANILKTNPNYHKKYVTRSTDSN